MKDKKEYLKSKYKINRIDYDVLSKKQLQLYKVLREVCKKSEADMILTNIINSFDGDKITIYTAEQLKEKLEIKDKILKLYRQGKTPESIAVEVRLTPSRVYQYINIFGIRKDK